MSKRMSVAVALSLLSMGAVSATGLSAFAEMQSVNPFELRSGGTFMTQSDILGPQLGRSAARRSVLGFTPGYFESTDVSSSFDLMPGATFKSQKSMLDAL